MTIYDEPRKDLIQWIRRQLIGPPEPPAGADPDAPDLCGVMPTERFPCGALYPISPGGEGIDPASEAAEEAEGTNEIEAPGEAEPVIVRRYIPPSSLGFSFFIKGDNIKFQLLCSGAMYEKKERDDEGKFKNDWKRKRFPSEGEDVANITCPEHDTHESFEKLEGRARTEVQWRRFHDGWIVTVSLCNAQELEKFTTGADYIRERAENTLFEASLRCVIDAGEFGEYPRVARNLLDEEEQEIELQYAHKKIYAIGHGCAADWKVEDGKVTEILSNTMPDVEVPQMTADTGAGGEAVLSLKRLADIERNHADLLPQLNEFVDNYEHWIDGQEHAISSGTVEDQDQPAAGRIVGRMKTAVKRMRASLAMLDTDARSRTAFALANQAMLDQMRQHGKLQGKTDSDDSYRWRPFQLAFLLTVLQSSAKEDDDFRDTVDLIWFPTGGGKTEAYLGLVAFQIALRRLRHPDTGGGTTILMRYTLRLLTSDQFIRATRLICALELLRRQRDDLGPEPVTIGIWVGKATSPNTFQEAAEFVRKAIAAGETPALVLERCPWCGTDFKADQNYDSTMGRFRFLCRNPECEFGATSDGVLPCNVVDEALYDAPPTMLVATVDKFARLAWEERANAFFGGDTHRPPELIIQDELHLIAGALGSVAGLYEAAIDTVLRLRGVYPKYIASTATIRMAKQQVKRLYGRDVAVFPPPGLNSEDAYFARVVPLDKRPGRIYVGYLAPLLNRQQCLAPLAATLLSAPLALFKGNQDEADLLEAWWTQVVYHGSLKGVGNSHTAFSSDVRNFMRLLLTKMVGEDVNQKDGEDADEPGTSERTDSPASIAQLTSLQTAAENTAIFNRLSVTREEDGCLDAVLATNMISVGLDVARLALMVINGQPLTTAEYIQASSRIGRGDVPGVVFANYYREQARSLSHYESFRPYHEAFYRFVEPTSVTPYTYQARMRALHAALVIVMRHGKLGLLENDAATRFDPAQPEMARALQEFEQRCKQSAPDQADEIGRHIDLLSTDWSHEVERCKEARRGLHYQVPDKDISRDRLLYSHDAQVRGLWPTLHSLRNVENTALLKVL